MTTPIGLSVVIIAVCGRAISAILRSSIAGSLVGNITSKEVCK